MNKKLKMEVDTIVSMVSYLRSDGPDKEVSYEAIFDFFCIYPEHLWTGFENKKGLYVEKDKREKFLTLSIVEYFIENILETSIIRNTVPDEIHILDFKKEKVIPNFEEIEKLQSTLRVKEVYRRNLLVLKDPINMYYLGLLNRVREERVKC